MNQAFEFYNFSSSRDWLAGRAWMLIHVCIKTAEQIKTASLPFNKAKKWPAARAWVFTHVCLKSAKTIQSKRTQFLSKAVIGWQRVRGFLPTYVRSLQNKSRIRTYDF
jgi:hypothetical protein